MILLKPFRVCNIISFPSTRDFGKSSSDYNRVCLVPYNTPSRFMRITLCSSNRSPDNSVHTKVTKQIRFAYFYAHHRFRTLSLSGSVTANHLCLFRLFYHRVSQHTFSQLFHSNTSSLLSQRNSISCCLSFRPRFAFCFHFTIIYLCNSNNTFLLFDDNNLALNDERKVWSRFSIWDRL